MCFEGFITYLLSFYLEESIRSNLSHNENTFFVSFIGEIFKGNMFSKTQFWVTPCCSTDVFSATQSSTSESAFDVPPNTDEFINLCYRLSPPERENLILKSGINRISLHAVLFLCLKMHFLWALRSPALWKAAVDCHLFVLTPFQIPSNAQFVLQK